jgi:hypothetical protein
MVQQMRSKQEESNRLLQVLIAKTSKLKLICETEKMERFVPHRVRVIEVANVLVESDFDEVALEDLGQAVCSAFSYHPGEFMDMYIIRADLQASDLENEKFEKIRTTVFETARAIIALVNRKE